MLNHFKCVAKRRNLTFYTPAHTHLPGFQLLRQRHLVFDGVEKLLS